MSVPNHIAIIPDGNRRWAKAHRFNPWQGHEEGSKRFWEISEATGKEGVKYLTIWAGSYDNLKKRSKVEVNFLFKLLRRELKNPKLLKQIFDNELRFKVLGEWREFMDKETILAVEDLEKQTSKHTKSYLTLLFGYDGQREMLSAINNLVGKGKKVTEESLRKSLWTAELPEVDLVIRTGGEPHWSAGFMMWHTANSQFYFTEQLWPEFKKSELKKALKDFEIRERRLGK
ncbi:MAG TPA: polyprenyl diphosphate synthase [Patescibacteria group bacterium]|jgi:undecaprenyl diphosphate synthase|nr:polyprenyl diphosphate synthase [Patescibacteria group bacterium]